METTPGGDWILYILEPIGRNPSGEPEPTYEEAFRLPSGERIEQVKTVEDLSRAYIIFEIQDFTFEMKPIDVSALLPGLAERFVETIQAHYQKKGRLLKALNYSVDSKAIGILDWPQPKKPKKKAPKRTPKS